MKSRNLRVSFLSAAFLAVIIGGCQSKANVNPTETPAVLADSGTTSDVAATDLETTAATSAQKATSSTKTKKLESESTLYSNDVASISHPHLSNLKDEKQNQAVNEKIKKNVALIADAIQADSTVTKLEAKEEIVNADDKRISIAYTGTKTLSDGNTQKVFFTNTIDFKTGKDLSLSDFADPYALADYILSDDVKLYNADKEVTEKFLSERHKLTLDEYVEILSNADFPFETDAEGKVISVPQSFSFVKNADVYFSIPTSKELGDYIIIVYSPDSK